jgi:Ran GTPase-activating protein (RanGAP) involved in mRNA processing and transport
VQACLREGDDASFDPERFLKVNDIDGLIARESAAHPCSDAATASTEPHSKTNRASTEQQHSSSSSLSGVSGSQSTESRAQGSLELLQQPLHTLATAMKPGAGRGAAESPQDKATPLPTPDKDESSGTSEREQNAALLAFLQGARVLTSPLLHKLDASTVADVQSITSSYGCMMRSAVFELTSHLPRLRKLQELLLPSVSLGAEGTSALAPSLIKLSSLARMSLRSNSIGDEGACALAPSLAKLSALTWLDLSSNSISYMGASALAPSLAKLSALECLHLNGNSIGDEGACALARSLACLTALRSLDLSLTEIGDEGTCALAPSLACITALSWLDLSRTKIGDEGACALARSLACLTALEWLDLSCTKIGDEGACALAPSLANLPALEWVILDGNSIGDECASVLARSFAKLCVAGRVFLRGTSNSHEGASAVTTSLSEVSRYLVRCHSIRGMSGSCDSDAGQPPSSMGRSPLKAHQLPAAAEDELLDTCEREQNAALLALLHRARVHTQPRLDTLDTSTVADVERIAVEYALEGKGDAFVVELAPHLPRLRKLRQLQLPGNEIRDDAAVALASALGTLGRVIALDVSYNDIGPAGLAALRQVLLTLAPAHGSAAPLPPDVVLQPQSYEATLADPPPSSPHSAPRSVFASCAATAQPGGDPGAHFHSFRGACAPCDPHAYA